MAIRTDGKGLMEDVNLCSKLLSEAAGNMADVVWVRKLSSGELSSYKGLVDYIGGAAEYSDMDAPSERVLETVKLDQDRFLSIIKDPNQDVTDVIKNQGGHKGITKVVNANSPKQFYYVNREGYDYVRYIGVDMSMVKISESTQGRDTDFVKLVRQELTKLSSKVSSYRAEDKSLKDVLTKVEGLLDNARQSLFDIE